MYLLYHFSLDIIVAFLALVLLALWTNAWTDSLHEQLEYYTVHLPQARKAANHAIGKSSLTPWTAIY